MSPENIDLLYKLLPSQLLNTIYMVIVSLILAILLGLPLGITLTLIGPHGMKPCSWLYKVLSMLVNITRSFPFAILMVVLIPFTRLLVGTSLGLQASIVPLAIAAAPLMARLVDTNLRQVDSHVVEAAIVMGSTPWQIISKVLLPEALPSLIQSTTLTAVNLIGCSAMVGMIGGGGLGQVAIQYGYHRFNPFVMFATVALLISLVQLVQIGGDSLSRWICKKQGRLPYA